MDPFMVFGSGYLDYLGWAEDEKDFLASMIPIPSSDSSHAYHVQVPLSTLPTEGLSPVIGQQGDDLFSFIDASMLDYGPSEEQLSWERAALDDQIAMNMDREPSKAPEGLSVSAIPESPRTGNCSSFDRGKLTSISKACGDAEPFDEELPSEQENTWNSTSLDSSAREDEHFHSERGDLQVQRLSLPSTPVTMDLPSAMASARRVRFAEEVIVLSWERDQEVTKKPLRIPYSKTKIPNKDSSKASYSEIDPSNAQLGETEMAEDEGPNDSNDNASPKREGSGKTNHDSNPRSNDSNPTSGTSDPASSTAEPGVSWEQNGDGVWEKKWFLERIINSRRNRDYSLWYQVKWAGSNAPQYTTWERYESIADCVEFLADFHFLNPRKPFKKGIHPRYGDFRRPEGWSPPAREGRKRRRS
ncbi:MAG: hypothetical protein Q9165_007330 [Trypethelium subeluteriae]